MVGPKGLKLWRIGIQDEGLGLRSLGVLSLGPYGVRMLEFRAWCQGVCVWRSLVSDTVLELNAMSFSR